MPSRVFGLKQVFSSDPGFVSGRHPSLTMFTPSVRLKVKSNLPVGNVSEASAHQSHRPATPVHFGVCTLALGFVWVSVKTGCLVQILAL